MAILRFLGAFGLIVLLFAVAGTLLYFVLVTLSRLFHDGVAAVREVSKNSDRPTRWRIAFEASLIVSSLIALSHLGQAAWYWEWRQARQAHS